MVTHEAPFGPLAGHLLSRLPEARRVDIARGRRREGQYSEVHVLDSSFQERKATKLRPMQLQVCSAAFAWWPRNLRSHRRLGHKLHTQRRITVKACCPSQARGEEEEEEGGGWWRECCTTCIILYYIMSS